MGAERSPWSLAPLPFGGGASRLSDWNGEVWYFADDLVNGSELWRSDGSKAGTQLAFEFHPGPGGSLGANSFTAATQGALFVYTFIEGTGHGLYAFDSPGAAPELLVQVPGSQFNKYIGYLGSIDSWLFFSHDDGVHGRELWISDGTPGGTQLFLDALPGPAGSDPYRIGATADRIWFGMIGQFDYELGVTDGTLAGTVTGLDLTPDGSVGMVEDAKGLAVDAGLFFIQVAFTPYRFPWFSDGTPTNTVQLADKRTEGEFFEHDGLVYFVVSNFGTNYELYASDGTPAGTGLAIDLTPGFDSKIEIAGSTPFGLLVSADLAGVGMEPYLVNMNPPTVQLLRDLNTGLVALGSDPEQGVEFQRQLYFGAKNEITGFEPYATDGTQAGTGLFAELSKAPSSGSAFLPLLDLGSRLLFLAAPTVETDRELWTTQGSPATAAKLIDLAPGPDELEVKEAVVIDGIGYLALEIAESGNDVLFRTNGLAGGSSVISQIQSGASGVEIRELTQFAGELWFVADDPSATGSELWKSDGTAAGTSLVADLVPGPAGSDPSSLTPIGDRLVFRATLPSTGAELYAADAAGNVALVVDLRPGPLGSQPRELVGLNNVAFFAADDGVHFEEPFVTDGTLGGTMMLGDLSANTGPSKISRATRAGDRVFFFSGDAEADLGLWSTAGSPATTILIADESSPGDELESQPIFPLGSGSDILLPVYETDLGLEPWVANENPGSLQMVADIHPHAGLSFPKNFARVGDRVVLSADDGVHGSEPYSVSIIGLGGYVAEPYGKACGSAAIGAEGAARLGSMFDVTLSSNPMTTAVLFVSAEGTFLPLLPGCPDLLGGQSFGLGLITTDAQGLAAKTIGVPQKPTLLSAPLFFQWVVLQPGGPLLNLIELSNGLEVWLGS